MTALARLFMEEITRSPLCAMYCYRCSDQPESSPAFETDGYSSWGTNGTLEIGSIGLAVEILHGDMDYAAFVWLHELAHLMVRDGHTDLFEAMLNELVEKYNSLIGTNLQNDYAEYAGNRYRRSHLAP